MDKDNESKVTPIDKRLFTLAGILLAVVMITSLVLISIYHSQSNTTYTNANKATTYLNQINAELAMVNRNVLMIISDAGDKEELAKSIDNSFANIDYYKEKYEQVGGRSSLEENRYEQAKTFIQSYRDKFEARRQNLSALDTALYIQEIHPLQTTATEMFNATIDINTENTRSQLANIAVLFNIIRFIILAMFILGEIAIFATGRTIERQNERIRKREKELKEWQERLKVPNTDTSKLSDKNSLTGLKNRYAFIEDVKKNNKVRDLDIVVFDVDKFHFINENFGYSFGDDYLKKLTSALKVKIGKYGELYSYSGNGFALIFNKGVDNMDEVCKQMHDVMNEKRSAGAITMDQTATGHFFHIPKNSVDDANKLFMQVDSSIRNSKDQGGNKLTGI